MILKNNISLDLGTSSVIIYIKGKGIVLQEPSLVAVNSNGDIEAIGEDAFRLLGRRDDLIVKRPLKNGTILDYNIVKEMVQYFLNKVVESGFFRPDVTICMPVNMTKVERNGIVQVAHDTGANKVHIVPEAIAAAVGAGIDIESPYANMIVDMGGGTTDISVICAEKIIDNISLKEGGDKINLDIRKYIKEQYNSDISIKSAENLKKRIGSAIICPRKESLEINVKDISTGEEKKIIIKNTEIQMAISKTLESIVSAIKNTLDRLEGEVLGDITNNGIYLTGGGSLLFGIDRLISAETGIKTILVDNPINSISIGASKL